MNNRELADTFTLIADLLEIKGEITYKTLGLPQSRRLPDIPGPGRQRILERG
jgi:hypothetical protein